MGHTGRQVGQQPGAQGVATVQTLHRAQVTGHLRHTLPEAQRQEVQRQSLSVKVTFSSCGLKHLQMVHCHLKDLGLLQFS